MAKAKSSPKAQENKNQKPKGVVPNYAKKIKPVQVGPKLPAVKLTYYGISTAVLASIYDKKNMAGVSHVDDQLCWQAATEFVYDFKHNMYEINEINYLGLSSVARKLFTVTTQTVKNINGNYQLDAVEVESFGSIVTKGVFKKRQRFWHYVELAAVDGVPPNLGFYFEDAICSDVYTRAESFDLLVKKYSDVAKGFIEEGFDPESFMRVDKEQGLLQAHGYTMAGEEKIFYQQLKYWAIDNIPAPIKESVLGMLEEKDEPRAYSNNYVSSNELTNPFKGMSKGQKVVMAALLVNTFLDKKAA